MGWPNLAKKWKSRMFKNVENVIMELKNFRSFNITKLVNAQNFYLQKFQILTKKNIYSNLIFLIPFRIIFYFISCIYWILDIFKLKRALQNLYVWMYARVVQKFDIWFLMIDPPLKFLTFWKKEKKNL